MKNTIMANGLKRSLAQIRYVSPVLPGNAEGVVATVYAQAEKDFGMVAPPVAMHSPSPSALVASWAMLRETLLATGQVDRAAKEVVAASVSVANACPYCVAIHTAAAQRRGVAVKYGAPAPSGATSAARAVTPLIPSLAVL